GYTMRVIERFLNIFVSGIIVTSPGFITHYFKPSGLQKQFILLENKVLLLKKADEDSARSSRNRPRPLGSGWTIAYAGLMRCRQSLIALSRLSELNPSLTINL